MLCLDARCVSSERRVLGGAKSVMALQPQSLTFIDKEQTASKVVQEEVCQRPHLNLDGG